MDGHRAHWLDGRGLGVDAAEEPIECNFGYSLKIGKTGVCGANLRAYYALVRNGR